MIHVDLEVCVCVWNRNYLNMRMGTPPSPSGARSNFFCMGYIAQNKHIANSRFLVQTAMA